MFRVGQKVVCVDALGGGGCLTQNAVYTCIGFSTDAHGRWILVDCCNGHGALPSGWFPFRFRPAVEHSTDITFAHEILRKATKRQRAPV